jgi:hypothetical protein
MSFDAPFFFFMADQRPASECPQCSGHGCQLPTSHEMPNWCCSNCGWVWRGKNPRGKLRELIDSICSLTLVTASLIGLIFGIAWLSHVIGVGM